MKKILKKILQYYLKYITKFVLFIHRPLIIAIAGSTNKTFTREAICKLLKEEGIDVKTNIKSFNTEIGLALDILNLPSGYNSYKNWLPIIINAFSRIFNLNFPKILALELGVSDRGDMKYLLSIIKPKIAVITDITQKHIEGFDYMDELVMEYEYLAKFLRQNDILILNWDNIRVKNLANKSRAKIEFFSLNKTEQNENIWKAVEICKTSNGNKIKISHMDNVYKIELNRFGEHHIYALLISLIIKKYVKKGEKILF